MTWRHRDGHPGQDLLWSAVGLKGSCEG